MVVVVLFGGCIAIVTGVGVKVDHDADVQHTVVYSATGSGTSTADITYNTLQEGHG